MSPKKFQTAVLCRYHAGSNYQSTLACAGWLLDLIRPAKVDLALARSGGKPEVKSVRSGFLQRLEDTIEDATVESIRLIVPEPGGAGYQMSFFLEKRREKDLVEYLRFLFPDAPNALDEEDRVKLVSCSIAQSVVSNRLRRQGERIWVEHWKRMFADLDAVSGYFTGTDLPLTSVFTIAPGQTGRASAAGARIYDIDYRTHLDGVYEETFLSQLHLRRVPDLQDRLEADATIETMPISDGEGRLCGLHVRPNEASPWGARRLAGLLEGLIHRPAEGTERSFLLLSRDEVAAMGGAETLGTELGTGRVSELPHGFVQIEENPVVLAEDYPKRAALLQRIYGRAYPGVARGKMYAHEMMERFEGLKDRRSIFFRIPTGKPRERALLVYFAAPDPVTECLSVHLLIAHDLPETDLARVKSVLEEWVAGVARNPVAYGPLEGIGPVEVTEFPGAKDVHREVHALDLRQEAINYLVMLVDQLNRESFRIPYLVFGEIRTGP